MKVGFDMSGLSKKLKKAADIETSVVKPAYKFFKEQTPKQTGNARRNTSLEGNKIVANYAYSGKLKFKNSKQNQQ